MAKKLIAVWLSLTVLLFSSITIYAGEDIVQGQFLNRTIDINGHRIENYYLEHPLFIDQGITYLPLTSEMGDLLGFGVEIDRESRTLHLLKKEPVRVSLEEEILKSNLINPVAKVAMDVEVILQAEMRKQFPKVLVTLQGVSVTAADLNIAEQLIEAKKDEDTLGIPVTVSEEVRGETYTLLRVGDVYYLPIRALTAETCFGWSVLYDQYSGLYISTDPCTPAATLFDAKESSYNRGLATYITVKNPGVSLAKATKLVFLFRHEAEINGVNERLLMAIAEKESTFRTDAVGGVAIGLMQIHYRTGERYGISKSQLFDPHVSIEFGARYITDKIDRYDDKVLALTAYNQGDAGISRGSYSTRYAGRITHAEQTIEQYLVQKGYGLGSEN